MRNRNDAPGRQYDRWEPFCWAHRFFRRWDMVAYSGTMFLTDLLGEFPTTVRNGEMTFAGLPFNCLACALVIQTASPPRSGSITWLPDGTTLAVANLDADSVTLVGTDPFSRLDEIVGGPHPIHGEYMMWKRGGGIEKHAGPAFDTPTLLGLYAATSFLHDGHAANLTEVLTTHNPADRHGTTSHLSQAQIEDLVAFLLSLPAGEQSLSARDELGDDAGACRDCGSDEAADAGLRAALSVGICPPRRFVDSSAFFRNHATRCPPKTKRTPTCDMHRHPALRFLWS